MTDTKYNGWTNWETWNFKLWVDNDQDSYNNVIELAEDINGRDNAKADLSRELEAWAENMLDELNVETGFFSDACNHAIKRINFYEIAESYLVKDWDDVEDKKPSNWTKMQRQITMGDK